MPWHITDVLESLEDSPDLLTLGSPKPIISMLDPEPGELVPGDHLLTGRGLVYAHHGLYVGDYKVVHYSGWHKPFEGGKVEEVAISDFHDGKGLCVERYPKRKYSNEESVLRIYSRLGEDKYSLLFNNCEHLVRWAITGQNRCEQFVKFLRRWAEVVYENEVAAKTRCEQIKIEYNRHKEFVDSCQQDLDYAIEAESMEFVNNVVRFIGNLEEAIAKWDSDEVIKSVSSLAEFYGEKLQYRSQEQFDALMEDESSVFKL